MSIQLRDGLANQTVDHILEDLLVRFVINCPEEDLSSIERVFFQVEEAQWFYTDFIRQLYPLFQGMKMKTFAPQLLSKCPLLWKWGDPADALSRFGKYKSTIPVRGIALLNKDMTKVVLVQGIHPSLWSFPRGKISKDEDDLVCAVREVREETGFDAKDYVNEKDVVERTVYGKNFKIYMARNVPEDYAFEPEVRNEIGLIRWFDIKGLHKQVKETPNKYFIVDPFLKPLTRWINKNKGVVSDEELMRLAEIKLKALMGILAAAPSGSADAGRELLDILQGVAKPPMLPPSSTLGSPTAVSHPQYLHNIYAGMGQMPQFFPPTNGFVPIQPFPPQANGGYFPTQGQHMQLPPPTLIPQASQPQQIPEASPAQQIPQPSPAQQISASPQSVNVPTNGSNSKELLSVLKGGPLKKPVEPKNTRAGEFLQMLSKKPDAPSTKSATPPKVLLRREKGDLDVNASATLLGLLGKKPPTNQEKAANEAPRKTNGVQTANPKSQNTAASAELLGLINGGKQASKSKSPQSSDKKVDPSKELLGLLKKPAEKNPIVEELEARPIAHPNEFLKVLNSHKPHEDKQASGELLSILNQPKKPLRIAKREEGSPELKSVLGDNASTPVGESSANTSIASLILSTLNRKSTTPQLKPIVQPTPPPEDFEDFENFDDFDELSASQNDIYNSIANDFDVDSDDNFEDAKGPDTEPDIVLATPQKNYTNVQGNHLLLILNGGKPLSTNYHDTYGSPNPEGGLVQQSLDPRPNNGADILRVLGRRPPTVESTLNADGRNELLGILKGGRS